MHSLNVIKNARNLPKPRVSRCREKQTEHKIRHLVKVSCRSHTVKHISLRHTCRHAENQIESLSKAQRESCRGEAQSLNNSPLTCSRNVQFTHAFAVQMFGKDTKMCPDIVLLPASSVAITATNRHDQTACVKAS